MKPLTDMVPDTAGEDASPVADHDVEVDGVQVAEAFGVPTPYLLAEMRRGNVHGKVERGIGADTERHRLSFRYRGRALAFIRHPDDRLAPDDGLRIPAERHEAAAKPANATGSSRTAAQRNRAAITSDWVMIPTSRPLDTPGM